MIARPFSSNPEQQNIQLDDEGWVAKIASTTIGFAAIYDGALISAT
jgi:hypothetical protein